MTKSDITTIRNTLKELGLADSYFFFGDPAIAMNVDTNIGEWVVYIGKVDTNSFGPRIIPFRTIRLSFVEGVGIVKVLRTYRMYTFSFDVVYEEK